MELTFNGKTWININTSRTNHIAYEAVKNQFNELVGYQHIRPEVKVGDSRIDLLLFDGDEKYKQAERKCYVEVKNVTLWHDGAALFPDGVSTRGQKHLNELIEIKKEGHEAVMLFVISREDVSSFSPAQEIDPEYAKLFKKAFNAGVKNSGLPVFFEEKETTITKSIPVKL